MRSREEPQKCAPSVMGVTILYICLYYEEKPRQVFFDDLFPSGSKSVQANALALLPNAGSLTAIPRHLLKNQVISTQELIKF